MRNRTNRMTGLAPVFFYVPKLTRNWPVHDIETQSWLGYNQGENRKEGFAMPTIENFPERYRKGIRTVSGETGADYETSLAMMLMTAMLMDLRPDDDEVVEIILTDYRRGTDVAQGEPEPARTGGTGLRGTGDLHRYGQDVVRNLR